VTGTCRIGSTRILKGVLNRSAALDLAFQALSDPTRRNIVARLAQRPRSVGELAEPLAMSLPAVMQHLRLLEASGLVRSEKVGRVRTCHLNAGALRRAEAWIGEQRSLWEARLDRLEAYLDETSGEDDHE
jgi:DNA-binding transcriptional ArsR family regulator